MLRQDVQRFFAIYENNLEKYGLSANLWALGRKLYAARLFYSLCDQGRPEAALDVFDREQLLPVTGQHTDIVLEADGEMMVEYPRIVNDYVRILRHAASQGVVADWALRSRIQQLQGFLAVHGHRLTLDQETIETLASLALS